VTSPAASPTSVLAGARPAMPPAGPQLAYFGHHKCASTWVHNVLMNVCDEAGWSCNYLANAGMFEHDLAAWLQRHPVDVLCYVNADIEQVRRLPPYRGFHMVRDPRDILTSAYFSHKHSHATHAWPELVEHRERLNAVSKDEGLLLELDFNADVFDEMRRWDYEQPEVLELRMEEFTPDPLNGWMRVFHHLDIVDERHHGKKAQLAYLLASSANVLKRHGRWPFGRRLPGLPAERLLGLVWNNRFETKTKGREAGKEDVESHYRKGVAGDWANHFTPRQVDAFKERYNDLLVQLGYETGADWGV